VGGQIDSQSSRSALPQVIQLRASSCAFRDHPITGSDNIRSVIPI